MISDFKSEASTYFATLAKQSILYTMYHLLSISLFTVINNYMLQKKERIPTKLRRRVIDRDGLWCVFCDEDLSNSEVHLDHVIPESKGGPTTYNNLQVTCRKCNLAKGTLTEEEFVSRLRKRAINILNKLGAG